MSYATGQSLSNRAELNFGRYQIQGRLGRGGMGTVYLAADRHAAGQFVAVKENVSTIVQVQQQFRREAEVLARLDHPNLPSITDYFVESDERQYLVMHYIDGENLRDILFRRSTALEESDILPWVEQIMDALTYMHTWSNQHTGKVNPIIHRDIKPGNIKRASNGKIYLVDFGIAKVDAGPPLGTSSSDMPYDGYSGLYGETPLPTSYRTVTGARAFSAGYSPIEQYTGGTDVRTDVYALGATLYALLTNRVPPEAPNIAVGQTFYPPRQFNPTISRQTERVILKSMSLQPKARYKSIEVMRHALHRRRWYHMGFFSSARPSSSTPPENRVQQKEHAPPPLSPATPPATPPAEAAAALPLAVAPVESTKVDPLQIPDSMKAAAEGAENEFKTDPALNPVTGIDSGQAERWWPRRRHSLLWAGLLGTLLVAAIFIIITRIGQPPIAAQRGTADLDNNGVVTLSNSGGSNSGGSNSGGSNSGGSNSGGEEGQRPQVEDPQAQNTNLMLEKDKEPTADPNATTLPTVYPAGEGVLNPPTSTPLVPTEMPTEILISPAGTETGETKIGGTETAPMEEDRKITLAPTIPDGTPTRAPTPTPTVNATATPSTTATATKRPTKVPTKSVTSTAQPTSAQSTSAQSTSAQSTSAQSTSTSSAMQALAARATATGTATATIFPTRALGRTPTPIPTFTATAIFTARPTAVPPTAVPPTAPPTIAPPPAATQYAVGSNALTLIAPRDSLLKGQYIFRWQTDLVLAANQAFEVVLWEEGADPMVAGLGPVAAGQYTEVRVNLDQAIDAIPQIGSGRQYRWGILLVETNPYRRITFLGQSHLFQLERSNGPSATRTPSPRG